MKTRYLGVDRDELCKLHDHCLKYMSSLTKMCAKNSHAWIDWYVSINVSFGTAYAMQTGPSPWRFETSIIDTAETFYPT